MKRFCDRIDKDVEIERQAGHISVKCRYFKMIPKGPACKRALFGRLGFPIPTPMSASKTVFKMLTMAMFDAMKVNIGMGGGISWHCPLYYEE